METKEEVKLPKHLQAAINQLEKQRAKYIEQQRKHLNNSVLQQELADNVSTLISGISEQIKKLKGE